MMPDQDPRLEGLDRQRIALEYLVGDLKTRMLDAFDPGFDRDPVAMCGGDVEFCPRIHHGNADQAVLPDDILL